MRSFTYIALLVITVTTFGNLRALETPYEETYEADTVTLNSPESTQYMNYACGVSLLKQLVIERNLLKKELTLQKITALKSELLNDQLNEEAVASIRNQIVELKETVQELDEALFQASSTKNLPVDFYSPDSKLIPYLEVKQATPSWSTLLKIGGITIATAATLAIIYFTGKKIIYAFNSSMEKNNQVINESINKKIEELERKRENEFHPQVNEQEILDQIQTLQENLVQVTQQLNGLEQLPITIQRNLGLQLQKKQDSLAKEIEAITQKTEALLKQQADINKSSVLIDEKYVKSFSETKEHLEIQAKLINEKNQSLMEQIKSIELKATQIEESLKTEDDTDLQQELVEIRKQQEEYSKNLTILLEQQSKEDHKTKTDLYLEKLKLQQDTIEKLDKQFEQLITQNKLEREKERSSKHKKENKSLNKKVDEHIKQTEKKLHKMKEDLTGQNATLLLKIEKSHKILNKAIKKLNTHVSKFRGCHKTFDQLSDDLHTLELLEIHDAMKMKGTPMNSSIDSAIQEYDRQISALNKKLQKFRKSTDYRSIKHVESCWAEKFYGKNPPPSLTHRKNLNLKRK
jgi:hypothetical protein